MLAHWICKHNNFKHKWCCWYSMVYCISNNISHKMWLCTAHFLPKYVSEEMYLDNIQWLFFSFQELWFMSYTEITRSRLVWTVGQFTWLWRRLLFSTFSKYYHLFLPLNLTIDYYFLVFKNHLSLTLTKKCEFKYSHDIMLQFRYMALTVNSA